MPFEVSIIRNNWTLLYCISPSSVSLPCLYLSLSPSLSSVSLLVSVSLVCISHSSVSLPRLYLSLVCIPPSPSVKIRMGRLQGLDPDRGQPVSDLWCRGWAQDPGRLPSQRQTGERRREERVYGVGSGPWTAPQSEAEEVCFKSCSLCSNPGLITWRTSGILIKKQCGTGSVRNSGSASEAFNANRGTSYQSQPSDFVTKAAGPIMQS